MKRIILIGETGSGKTTLSQLLNNQEIKYYKTQQVHFSKIVIDTPGEFMENRFYYNALVTSSVEADYIALVQSIKSRQSFFPPSFASRFTKPVIGIITKLDLQESEKELDETIKWLKLAGAQEVFPLSTFGNQGIEDLKYFLK